MNTQYDKDLTWFKKCLQNNNLVEKLKKIKLIITDIDGSLTDAKIGYTQEDEDARYFSIQDGFAIGSAVKHNLLRIAFLSGKNHNSAFLRAQKLGISREDCIEGREDKLDMICMLQKKHDITHNETIFFGDDWLDTQVKLQEKNLFFSVPCSAPFYFHHVADLVVPKGGGDHAFRLLLDLVLYVQNKHFAQEVIDSALTHEVS